MKHKQKNDEHCCNTMEIQQQLKTHIECSKHTGRIGPTVHIQRACCTKKSCRAARTRGCAQNEALPADDQDHDAIKPK